MCWLKFRVCENRTDGAEAVSTDLTAVPRRRARRCPCPRHRSNPPVLRLCIQFHRKMSGILCRPTAPSTAGRIAGRTVAKCSGKSSGKSVAQCHHTMVGNVDMLNVAKMAVHLPANDPAVWYTLGRQICRKNGRHHRRSNRRPNGRQSGHETTAPFAGESPEDRAVRKRHQQDRLPGVHATNVAGIDTTRSVIMGAAALPPLGQLRPPARTPPERAWSRQAARIAASPYSE